MPNPCTVGLSRGRFDEDHVEGGSDGVDTALWYNCCRVKAAKNQTAVSDLTFPSNCLARYPSVGSFRFG